MATKKTLSLSDVCSETIHHKNNGHWQPTHLASEIGKLAVPPMQISDNDSD
jgi:hypothetical protein